MTSALRPAPLASKAFGTQKTVSPRLSAVQQRSPSSSARQPQLPQRSVTVRPSSKRSVKTHAVPMEVYEVADLGGFIGGTAATIFAMTLVGLAIGFVLLRFEALVEEGKI